MRKPDVLAARFDYYYECMSINKAVTDPTKLMVTHYIADSA